MKTLPITEAKIHLSSLLREVASGSEIAISYGKEKETVAVIIPYAIWKKSKKRTLGTLKNKAEVVFSEQFSMTDEELINL